MGEILCGRNNQLGKEILSTREQLVMLKKLFYRPNNMWVEIRLENMHKLGQFSWWTAVKIINQRAEKTTRKLYIYRISIKTISANYLKGFSSFQNIDIDLLCLSYLFVNKYLKLGKFQIPFQILFKIPFQILFQIPFQILFQILLSHNI